MFFQTLAQAIRIPLDDGTRLAAVKFIAGGGNPTGQGSATSGAAAGSSPSLGADQGLLDLAPEMASGADAVTGLLGLILR
jgi:hypothetical protein